MFVYQHSSKYLLLHNTEEIKPKFGNGVEHFLKLSQKFTKNLQKIPNVLFTGKCAPFFNPSLE